MLPDTCPGCHHVFTDTEKQTVLGTDIHRHQVAGLPVVTADITEYQCAAVRCPCGRVTRFRLPPEAQSGFGPGRVTLVAHLTAWARTPRRTMAQVLDEVFGIRIALGSTERLIEEASQALQQPCDALPQQLRHEMGAARGRDRVVAEQGAPVALGVGGPDARLLRGGHEPECRSSGRCWT